MMMKTTHCSMAAAMATLLLATSSTAQPTTVADVAATAGDFDILVGALNATGLLDTLTAQDGSQFTVFAPTNDAFEESGILLDDLLDPEWRTHVQDLLLFHVLGDSVNSSMLTQNSVWHTLNLGDENLTVTGDDPVQLFNIIANATIINPDIEMDNGVVHAVDQVLFPFSAVIGMSDLLTIFSSFNMFTVLTELLVQTGLWQELDEMQGPMTLFAPTDAAFQTVPQDVIEGYLADPEKLRDLLLYHIVDGENIIMKQEATTRPTVFTALNGQDLVISSEEPGETGMVNGEDVELGGMDILVSNGVLQSIGLLLIPPPNGTDILDMLDLPTTIVDATPELPPVTIDEDPMETMVDEGEEETTDATEAPPATTDTTTDTTADVNTSGAPMQLQSIMGLSSALLVLMMVVGI